MTLSPPPPAAAARQNRSPRVFRRHSPRFGVRPPRAPSKALLLLCALLYLSAHKALQDVLEHHAASMNSILLSTTSLHSSPLRALSAVTDVVEPFQGTLGRTPPRGVRAIVVATTNNNNNNNTTTDTTNSSPYVWNNPHNVVHVVQTRFMQYQPHLTALAHARLELFRIFCLPLLQHQPQQEREQQWPRPLDGASRGSGMATTKTTTTTTTFLWIIRIDPDLDLPVVQRLIELLQSAGANDDNTNNNNTHNGAHVLIVASNDNPKFRQESPNPTHLVWGNVNVWQSYFNAAHTHTLLETRLDADDGLAFGYLEQLQQRAHQSVDRGGGGGVGGGALSSLAVVDSPVVRVYCVDAHLEWHQPSQADLDLTVASDKEDETATATVGTLVGVRTPHCVTPGLTVASPPGIDDWANVPVQHHRIHKLLPRCHRTLSSASSSLACYERFVHQDHWPMAIRARTVTSAGMNRVLLPLERHQHHHHHHSHSHSDSHESSAEQKKADHLQNSAWRSLLPPWFGIHRDDVALLVRHYFNAGGQGTETRPYGNGTTAAASSASLLAQQALEGQCTPGHSCKEGARQTLQAMVKAAAAAAAVQA